MGGVAKWRVGMLRESMGWYECVADTPTRGTVARDVLESFEAEQEKS